MSKIVAKKNSAGPRNATGKAKLALPVNEKSRRDKIRRLIKKQGWGGLLVSKEINVGYLTGFTGDSSYLLITPENDLMISDSRYTTQIEEECGSLDKVIRNSDTTTARLLSKTVKSFNLTSLAVEAQHLSKMAYDQLAGELGGLELIDSVGTVEELRQVKDSSELKEIKHSIDLAERSFHVIRHSMRGDQTEAEIAHNLEHQIRMFGGDRCAFEPIVGVGERAALPHAVKTHKKIEECSFVLIDWGAVGRRYASDLTRVLITGKPTAKIEKIYNTVLGAQLKAIQKIRPGARVADVDRAARGYIESAGYGKKFGHGLGHGFGLEIHESPFLSPLADAELKPGMVVTVEPGIYLPGWGGVRIEDDVLVTNDGYQVLTSVPKSFEESIITLPG